MWESIARLVLKFRLFCLIALLSVTAFMAYRASRVKLSYDFTRTIPTDNPKYKAYQEFRKRFGDDGNLLVVGVQTDKLFQADVFADYIALTEQLKKIPGVDNVLGISSAINLIRDTATDKFKAVPIFPKPPFTQARIDSSKAVLLGLPFYRGILYNAESGTWLMAVNVNKDIMNSSGRIVTVGAITQAIDSFGRRTGLEMHVSGLPLIRTKMAVKISKETTWFLLGSVLILSVIMLFFFRSIGTMLLSLAVVIIGVVFSLGTMDLFGYKITLLNALTPTLVVVIGIPNCIYFMNKYHTAFRDTGDKHEALVTMIGRMGIVTFFCNLTAAIGFGVFALTRSAILNEFGVVAGINIMLLFFISFILIPAVLSYLPAPTAQQMRYLENRWLTAILKRLEIWTLQHRGTIYVVTGLVLAFSIAGMFRLQAEGFIVDDLPQKDPLYLDLKFFEKNFKGVMPLEIVIDTKRKKGLRAGTIRTLDSVDELSKYIAARPEMARPLSLVEGLKFIRQAYYGGDSSGYTVPSSTDMAFLSPYLEGGGKGGATGSGSGSGNLSLQKLLKSFVDSNQERLRISVNMADIGSKRLPVVLAELEQKTRSLFDSSKYNVEFTGTSVTYLEGSSFVIKGLRDSIQWAFLLIAACMLMLFRSVRILICSLAPNVIPLIITAGIMGWVGVRLKPSTVIVFSIALGIAIDITIRFLVNYKQEKTTDEAGKAVIDTINKTGISILYTSLVLIAGFVIFCFSDFGGIAALGWLTSVTLVIATLTNLIFLPALLLTLTKKRK
jgi:uncharacterized protein